MASPQQAVSCFSCRVQQGFVCWSTNIYNYLRTVYYLSSIVVVKSFFCYSRMAELGWVQAAGPWIWQTWRRTHNTPAAITLSTPSSSASGRCARESGPDCVTWPVYTVVSACQKMLFADRAPSFVCVCVCVYLRVFEGEERGGGGVVGTTHFCSNLQRKFGVPCLMLPRLANDSRNQVVQ